jgi:hypothetical protein
MRTWVRFLVLSSVTGAIGIGSQLQGAGGIDARNALARRAARVEAIRRLAERIEGLSITSNTKVKDFVAESDTIHACLDAFLSGMRETNVSYKEDGACEVTMEVKLATVIETLREIHNRYYKGDHFKADDFVQMTQTNKETVLKETGTGVPPSVNDEVGQTTVIPQKGLGSSVGWGPKAKIYWTQNVKPQGRLLAVRAARLDGMRRLVERIAGTQINSDTLVRNFVTERDDINALASAMLADAREQSVCYHDDEPVVEVEMAVTLETVWETVKTWSKIHYKGDKVKIKEFEERCPPSERKMRVIRETGMGCVGAEFLNSEGPAEVMATATAAQGWPAAISETGTAPIDTVNPDKAQARLLARRAAELDARRKLAEKIDGLQINPHTRVKDFVARHGTIKTAMMIYQQGAYVVEGSDRELPDGTVETTVAIDTAPLWDTIMRYERTTVTTDKNDKSGDE